MIICPNCGEVHRDDQKFCKNCGKPLKSSSGWKKKLFAAIVILIIVIIVGVFLLNGFSESDEYNNPASAFYINNDDTIDDSVNSQDEDVKLKNVDFNGLFKMYVLEDSDLYEYSSPQYNSNHEWRDNNYYGSVSYYSNILYYDQYDDINDILSIFKNAGYDFDYTVEGSKIIFTPDNHYGETSFVGVVSDDNEIVILSGDDLGLLKKSADTLVFE